MEGGRQAHVPERVPLQVDRNHEQGQAQRGTHDTHRMLKAMPASTAAEEMHHHESALLHVCICSSSRLHKVLKLRGRVSLGLVPIKFIHIFQGWWLWRTVAMAVIRVGQVAVVIVDLHITKCSRTEVGVGVSAQ